jgi:hypothetical protein
MNASFGFYEGQRLLHASYSNRGFALRRAIAPEEREKALGRDANGGLGFSVDARGLRRAAQHPSAGEERRRTLFMSTKSTMVTSLPYRGSAARLTRQTRPSSMLRCGDEERRAVG